MLHTIQEEKRKLKKYNIDFPSLFLLPREQVHFSVFLKISYQKSAFNMT